MSISTTVLTLLSEFNGSLTFTNIWCAIGLGFVTAILVFFKLKEFQWNIQRPATFDISMGLLFFFFCFRFFGWLLYPRGNNFFTLDGNNFGDLPWHMTSIENLARTTKFWPENPILTGEQFHYPFGIDLFSAMFLKLGAPLQNQLPIIGFICGLMLLVIIYMWSGGFGIGAFLFSGGLAGFQIFRQGFFKDYQSDLAWKNLPLALYMTQRGFLYAFPAGLLVLWSWRKRFLLKSESLPMILEGLLWGTMPLFHIHTFLFLSALFAIWVVASREWDQGLKIFGFAVLPATYEMARLTDNFHRASVLQWKPGWMIEFHHSGILVIADILNFFSWNYGLFFPLACVATWIAIKSKKDHNELVIVPAAVIYFICLFVMFAPWDWDNTKLMAWSYILALPVIWETCLKPVQAWIREPLLWCMFLSGFVCLFSVYTGQGFEIYQRDSVDRVCGVLEAIPHESRIAIAQSHNHPVLLCGHMAVAGYAGHLWSHGIPGHEIIENKLKQLMLGVPEWRQIAKEIQARYLFWGAEEEKDFSKSTKIWATGTKVVGAGSWGTIYDLGEFEK
jgi:hypothetical protein